MEKDTDTVLISKMEFSRLGMKKEFSMILMFGHFVWEVSGTIL